MLQTENAVSSSARTSDHTGKVNRCLQAKDSLLRLIARKRETHK